uniref:interferon a3-like n=1 Tax=Semicossyphus pulcher TaxID=241346 RepID=UPI0037E9585A
MLSRVLCVCVFLSVFGAASSLSCRWMDGKFRQFSEEYLDLLNKMANNGTNSTEDAEVMQMVAFPSELYMQASKATAEDKLVFTVQVLEESAALLKKNHSSASWEEKTVDNFLNVVTRQAVELHSCIRGHVHKKNKKLHMSFKRLSHVLEQKDHSAESWELIRKDIERHLMRVDQLTSSLRPAN